ncbi:hypothetical protein Tco_0491657 [Tanacetum coccineum]
MTTLVEHMIVAGVENRPPMLDKTMYNSWKSRMLLYIKGKKNGRMMLESIESGPLVYPTIEENGQIRNKKYVELSEQEKLQDDCDVQAINIVLQGLPLDVYSLVNHCQSAKDIWDRVKLLMQGTELSYQEHECKPYNEFDKFTSIKEWSKFVTDVKLAKNMYNTNFDQLYAYLSQHEGHANEVRMMRERYPDPLELPQINHPTPPVPQNAYHSPLISPQPQTESPQLDSGLVVPIFLPGDDPITCLNKAMAFMSTVVASRLLFNKFKGDRVKVLLVRELREMLQVQGETMQLAKEFCMVQGKMLLVQAQEYGQVLDEEQLAFLADPGIPNGQAIQTTIPQNAAFQTDDLDAYDSDCDDISSVKSVLMANLSSYDSDVLSEYLQQTQNTVVQDTNSSAQQDSMIISMFEQMSEQMSNQVTHWDKVNQETKTVNESLTAELERYKE